jgi:hypothetical protein
MYRRDHKWVYKLPIGRDLFEDLYADWEGVDWTHLAKDE